MLQFRDSGRYRKSRGMILGTTDRGVVFLSGWIMMTVMRQNGHSSLLTYLKASGIVWERAMTATY